MGKNKHPVECSCQRTEREQQEALINQQKHIDLVRRLKAEGFSDPAMPDWTFENDNGRSPQMHYAHRYVEQWQIMRSENLGLLLWGGVGTGKSFLAGCIANALMEQEVPVRMTNFARILNELNSSFSGRDDSPKNSILIYTTEDGLTKIDTTFDGDTVWLSIDQMAELFQRDKSTISRHIKNIFAEGELERDSVVAKFATTAADGKTYQVEFYNLDVIISVGYRVKSKRGTQFRIWATGILKEYMRKGFALDDERLKNLGGGGYFKELLERIRDIRASEKVFYRQVLEIYATSIDYDPKAEISVQFFKKVQNKIHYAIHGQTAADVIYNRADAEKEFMGLTTFAGNQPTLREATIAKNYLNEKELRAMGQLVSGYLDFTERQAEREQPMTMQDWANHLDRILTMSGEQLLVGNGTVTHKQAVDKATTEYRKYKSRTLSDVEQDYLDSIQFLREENQQEITVA